MRLFSLKLKFAACVLATYGNDCDCTRVIIMTKELSWVVESCIVIHFVILYGVI